MQRSHTRLRLSKPRAIGLLAILATAAAGGAVGPASASGGDASGTPIRIGVIVDVSGPFSSNFSFAVDVASAWVEHTNADGGVAGHPVELVIQDTKGDPATATSFAQEFIDDPSVGGIFLSDVATESVVAPLFSAAELPVIGGHGYTPSVWGAAGMGLPYVYQVTTNFPIQSVDSAVINALSVGATTWVAALCGEVPSCLSAEPLYAEATERLGLVNAGTIQALASAPDFTALCLEAINRGTDFLSMQTSGFVAVRVAADCRTQGYEGWIGIGQATAIDATIGELDHVTGPLNSFPWFVDAPPVQEFRDMMEEQGVPEATWSNVLGTSGYATMELFQKTIEAAGEGGDVTRESIIAAYSQVTDETLDGLLPQPLSFPEGEPPQAITCFWMYEKDAGEITGDFEPTCAE